MVNNKQFSNKELAKKLGILSTLTSLSVAGLLFIGSDPNRFNNEEYATEQTTLLSKISADDDKSSSAKKNPTSLTDAELEKPENYPYWLQYWGPWAQKFHGIGTGGEKYSGTFSNWGCVVTSTAIQAARSGVKKAQNGSSFNPGSMTDGYGEPYNAQNIYKFTDEKGEKGTINRGAWPGGGPISAAQALEECKKIASAGNYPEIRVDGGGGGAGHTVAYWKAGDGKPLVYDPSRGYYGDTVKGWYWVTPIEMKGAGIKKFSEDSPGPDGGSDGSTSSDSDSSSDSKGNSDGVNKIKPIFNPFKTPTVKVLPADANDDVNNPMDNKAMLAIQDGLGPTILSYFRVFMTLMIYVYIAIGIIGVLMKLADMYFGGILSLGINKSGGFSNIIAPNGNIMGIGGNRTDEIVKDFIIKYGIISSVLMLVASGSLSKLVAVIIGAFARLTT